GIEQDHEVLRLSTDDPGEDLAVRGLDEVTLVPLGDRGARDEDRLDQVAPGATGADPGEVRADPAPLVADPVAGRAGGRVSQEDGSAALDVPAPDQGQEL